MDKFTSQAQVEETADFQAWLDAQEVADIRAMEAEALARTRQQRGGNLAVLDALILREHLRR